MKIPVPLISFRFHTARIVAKMEGKERRHSKQTSLILENANNLIFMHHSKSGTSSTKKVYISKERCKHFEGELLNSPVHTQTQIFWSSEGTPKVCPRGILNHVLYSKHHVSGRSAVQRNLIKTGCSHGWTKPLDEKETLQDQPLTNTIAQKITRAWHAHNNDHKPSACTKVTF